MVYCLYKFFEKSIICEIKVGILFCLKSLEINIVVNYNNETFCAFSHYFVSIRARS